MLSRKHRTTTLNKKVSERGREREGGGEGGREREREREGERKREKKREKGRETKPSGGQSVTGCPDKPGHKIGGMSGSEPGTSWFRVEHSAATPSDPSAEGTRRGAKRLSAPCQLLAFPRGRSARMYPLFDGGFGYDKINRQTLFGDKTSPFSERLRSKRL
ncbi:hypothetical protein Bbelb_093510 [Branchiostoma belcheri]|nr:hypothetical protein Bbelb_093510 [Branchiostoma belcheri]